MERLSHGAEAILVRIADTVVKERAAKPYRQPCLDKQLRKSRQRREAKIIQTLERAGMPVPKVISSDENEMKLVLSFIDGPKVRDVIDTDPERFGKALGTLLACMHQLGIAHGDPTTSNFIFSKDDVYVIDFGLSFFTQKIEDFAVDLHLLRKVLDSTHTRVYGSTWKAALVGYEKTWPAGKRVIDWLETRVEQRGRNKRK